jgi:hypothetical protein
MHALLVQLEIDAGREDEAIGFLNNAGVPMISSGRGFVSGTWMRAANGTTTRSLMLYETKDAADDAAARASQGPPPGAPTTFVSAEVFEVLAQA